MNSTEGIITAYLSTCVSSQIPSAEVPNRFQRGNCRREMCLLRRHPFRVTSKGLKIMCMECLKISVRLAVWKWKIIMNVQTHNVKVHDSYFPKENKYISHPCRGGLEFVGDTEETLVMVMNNEQSKLKHYS